MRNYRKIGKEDRVNGQYKPKHPVFPWRDLAAGPLTFTTRKRSGGVGTRRTPCSMRGVRIQHAFAAVYFFSARTWSSSFCACVMLDA